MTFAESRVGPARRSKNDRDGAYAALTSPYFLLAVGLLLLNDWVLKPAFGNWVTGKLSDFAGLAAFAMFWAAIIPRRRLAAFMLTGGAFVFWKLPLSDGMLELWNGLGVVPVSRVKDYSDLLALLVLIPAWHVSHSSAWQLPPRPAVIRRFGAVSAAALAIVAFSATSISYPVPLTAGDFEIPAARYDVIAAVDSIRVHVSKRPKKAIARAADTLVLGIRHPPERWLFVTVEFYDTHPGHSRIRPIALRPHSQPQASGDAVKRAFARQVVQPLREWFAQRAAHRR